MIELHDLNFREAADIKLHGLHYVTFFGGSSESYQPVKDETAYFRNFKMGEYSSSTLPSRMTVNACDEGLHNCAATATCNNVNGQGFECICNEGLQGDGTQCEDIDECNNDVQNLCGADSVCVNTVGSYFCPVAIEPLIDVPSVECTGEPKDAIKAAFSLASGPINTGSANFGYGNCVDGQGDIKQTYPQGLAGSSGGSGFYWQLSDGGHDERTSLTIKYDVFFNGTFEFVKGGKLPGMYGGKMGCGGGVDAAEQGCFSGNQSGSVIQKRLLNI